MFTGLIQAKGEFVALKKSGDSARLQVRCGPWNPPLAIGESVAVDGACLTVAEASGSTATFDVLAETLEKTCLGDKTPGAMLNLERALRLGKRDKLHYTIRPGGEVVLTRAEVASDDPVLGQFLGFLARDMAGNPDRLRAMDAGLAGRIQALVADVEIDLDQALPADGE